MQDRVREIAERAVLGSLRAWVRDLDPASLDAPRAVALVELFAAIERLAAAGKALAASATGSAWRDAGARSVEDWLATLAGTTVAEARAALHTVACLQASELLDEAYRAGRLSPKQAEAIAGPIAAAPAKAEELLDAAARLPLQKLRDEAARVRAAAEPDPSARHERIHRSRSWRRWTDAEGARCGSYRLTPEAAAKLEAAAQPHIDAAIDRARQTGEHEPAEAYAADGLVGMAESSLRGDAGTDVTARGGRGRRRTRNRRELIGIVDLNALRRGRVLDGETCEIAGVGPVPVDVAREVFGDALLRIVIRDGVDIRTVVHTGRTASALQETAVLVRDGGRCVRPSCGWAISEIDHVREWATTGVTTLDHLAGLCDHDHDLKTRHGHAFERTPDGQVRWFRPDGTVEEGGRIPP